MNRGPERRSYLISIGSIGVILLVWVALPLASAQAGDSLEFALLFVDEREEMELAAEIMVDVAAVGGDPSRVDLKASDFVNEDGHRLVAKPTFEAYVESRDEENIDVARFTLSFPEGIEQAEGRYVGVLVATYDVEGLDEGLPEGADIQVERALALTAPQAEKPEVIIHSPELVITAEWCPWPRGLGWICGRDFRRRGFSDDGNQKNVIFPPRPIQGDAVLLAGPAEPYVDVAQGTLVDKNGQGRIRIVLKGKKNPECEKVVCDYGLAIQGDPRRDRASRRSVLRWLSGDLGISNSGKYEGELVLDRTDPKEPLSVTVTVMLREHVSAAIVLVVLGFLISAAIGWWYGPDKERREKEAKQEELDGAKLALRRAYEEFYNAHQDDQARIEIADICQEIVYLTQAIDVSKCDEESENNDQSETRVEELTLEELQTRLSRVAELDGLFYRFQLQYAQLAAIQKQVEDELKKAKEELETVINEIDKPVEQRTEEERKRVKERRDAVEEWETLKASLGTVCELLWAADDDEAMDAAQDELIKVWLAIHALKSVAGRAASQDYAGRKASVFPTGPSVRVPMKKNFFASIGYWLKKPWQKEQDEKLKVVSHPFLAIVFILIRVAIIIASGIYVVYYSREFPTYGTAADHLYTLLWGVTANAAITAIESLWGSEGTVLSKLANILKAG